MSETKPFVRVEGSITITFPYSEREPLQMTREEARELYQELGKALGGNPRTYPEDVFSSTLPAEPCNNPRKYPAGAIGGTDRPPYVAPAHVYRPPAHPIRDREVIFGKGPPD